MKKYVILIAFLLTACQSKPVLPPVSGELQPINTAEVMKNEK
ncbi:conjugal transfer protein [Providencia rettgeri]